MLTDKYKLVSFLLRSRLLKLIIAMQLLLVQILQKYDLHVRIKW